MRTMANTMFPCLLSKSVLDCQARALVFALEIRAAKILKQVGTAGRSVWPYSTAVISAFITDLKALHGGTGLVAKIPVGQMFTCCNRVSCPSNSPSWNPVCPCKAQKSEK